MRASNAGSASRSLKKYSSHIASPSYTPFVSQTDLNADKNGLWKLGERIEHQ